MSQATIQHQHPPFPNSQYPVSIFQFHDSFNFDAELKETLNESSGVTVPLAFSYSDKGFKISLLRESDPKSTPWHIGCKLFRRFKQISL
jgi:hypothetical protein